MSHPFQRVLTALFIVAVLVCTPGLLVQQTRAEAADFALPNGHFYTQAAGSGAPAGYGYAITDEGTDSSGQVIRLHSEFKRLGGVTVLGYPASRRFVWNGFICQVTQRVVLQWRPETNSVAFLNVMDLITQAGRDDYLYVVRQTPNPANYSAAEQGMTFQQIMARRYALLDAYPAIKARYFAVSDPLALHGLPVAPVTEMGNAFVLRAQRVIIQQWKIDVPWAKAGDVTVALGGDIAKEIGLVAAQDAQAGVPTTSTGASGSPTPPPATATPVPPQYQYGQDGATRVVQNCGLTEARGFIRDENGAPLANHTVKVGARNGDWSVVSALTGPDGQYNVFLDARPKPGAWYIFVIGVNNTQLSPIINFDTVGTCNPGDPNSVFIDFKRGATAPRPAPTAVPQPTPMPVPSGNLWRIVEFRQLTPCENHGQHNLFINVQDAAGAPLNGVPVVFEVSGGHYRVTVVSGDKGPGKAEVDIWKNMNPSVAYVAGGNSDVTPEFRTDIWGQDTPCKSGNDGNTTYHFSYTVTFRRSQ